MNQKALTITVRLVGADEDGGDVRFDDFRQFCVDLSRCLREAEKQVAVSHERIPYRVVSLSSSSAVMVLEALPPKGEHDHREQTLSFFKMTITCLQEGKQLDTPLPRDTLDTFRRLVHPLRHSTKQVWIDGVQLTSEFEVSIEKIIGASVVSRGSVSGILERVNVHGTREFVLYPPVPKSRVRCVFEERMLDEIRASLKRHVTVFGTMHYRRGSALPDLVHVEKMVIHPPDDELPTLRSLKGLAPECTSSIDSVSFVRAIRDEE